MEFNIYVIFGLVASLVLLAVGFTTKTPEKDKYNYETIDGVQ